MSEGPRVRSLNAADSDDRPVLGPAGNKARTVNPATKPHRKVDKAAEVEIKTKKAPLLPSILRQSDVPVRSNLSMNASCSSDASTDSSHSRGSSGRAGRRTGGPVVVRRKECGVVVEKIEKEKVIVDSKALDGSPPAIRRCAWVTPNTDPCYIAFHDEEWGVPVHEDKKLFELLVLSGALAELTWPAILNKRHLFREVFLEFDPIAVAKLNDKKIATPGSAASSLLSELKLRAIIENARQIVKIINEFGSFEKYIWNFVNHKPIVGKFRYPRQVPVKTSKAEAISKDLVKRGFRSVSPTVIYSFMQVSGITIDHLISCFRFQDCIIAVDSGSKDNGLKATVKEKQADPLVDLESETDLEVARIIDELSLSAG